MRLVIVLLVVAIVLIVLADIHLGVLTLQGH